MLVQVLYRELDEKCDEVTKLLSRAERMLSRCAANTELRDTVDRLRLTALHTRDTADKSQV